MADQVAGGEHFRTTVEKGLEIIKALRGWTSGLAVPHFVIDAPGGGGKVPLLPEYVEQMNEQEVVFRNYGGDRYVYKQPATLPNGPERQEIAAENKVVPIKRPKRAKKEGGAAPKRQRKTGT
jgi:lysine 2,3-aminomutase